MKLTRISAFAIALAIASSTALAAPPTSVPPLTQAEKLTVINTSLKLKLTGLDAPVTLSARKLHEPGRALMIAQSVNRVDPEQNEIVMQSSAPVMPQQRIEVRFKPTKVDQIVLIDVVVNSNTNGQAKVVVTAQGATARKEVTLDKLDQTAHVTLAIRASSLNWESFFFSVVNGNVSVLSAEVTPAK
jgi:hypothetical protein